MTAYYNEVDGYAAQWLRNLIAAGLIAPGEVDERDIRDVRPVELAGYTQCHFFAGIGVWSYALRRAGWPDDRPVWTGSCPCQPFSTAGRGGGFADERHLWPAFHHLISQCRPPVVFGEQVAGKAVGPWIDLVQDDLEAVGYAFGAVPFPAAGVGAPHIRDRVYWMADAVQRSSQQPHRHAVERRRAADSEQVGMGGGSGLMADAGGEGLPARQRLDLRREGRREEGRATEQRGGASGRVGVSASVGRSGRTGYQERQRAPQLGSGDTSESGGVGDPHGRECGLGNLQSGGQLRLQPQDGSSVRQAGSRPQSGSVGRMDWPGPTNGFWRDPDWLLCRDGRWRPVEPGAFPLAHGAPARVGRLRAYGNAIVAEAAIAFIKAVMEARS